MSEGLMNLKGYGSGGGSTIVSTACVTNVGVFVDKDNWVKDNSTGYYKNVITIEGLNADSYCELGLSCLGDIASEDEEYNYSLIKSAKTSENTLTLYASKALTKHIVIVLKDDQAVGNSIITNATELTSNINSLLENYETMSSLIGNEDIGEGTITSTIAGLTNDISVLTETTNNVNDRLNSNLANGKISFGIDSDGNYGYIKDGADSVTPFKSGSQVYLIGSGVLTSVNVSSYITSQKLNIDFKKLTISNFIVEIVSRSALASSNKNPDETIVTRFDGFSLNKSYNATTGLVSFATNIKLASYSVKDGGQYGSLTLNSTASVRVYMVI